MERGKSGQKTEFRLISYCFYFEDSRGYTLNQRQNKLVPEVVVPTPKQANLIW